MFGMRSITGGVPVQMASGNDPRFLFCRASLGKTAAHFSQERSNEPRVVCRMDRLNFETDGRDWPNREHSRFVAAAGFIWHVQIIGTGPVFLLLHGTGASTHSFRALIPLLKDHFTLVIPDLPGHGFTATPPSEALTLPGMAAATAKLLDKLDVKPALAAGHSAGVAVLIRMALDRSIAPKAIISINGALEPFGGAAGPFLMPFTKLVFFNPLTPRFFAWRASDSRAVEKLLTATGSKITAEDVELYGRLFRSPAHCAAALGMMAQWDLHSLQGELRKLPVELILVTGLKDTAVPPRVARRVAGLVPHNRIVEIEGSGHLTHEEQPEAVARIIFEAENPG